MEGGGAIQLKSVSTKSNGSGKAMLDEDGAPYTSEISKQRSKRTSQKRGSGLL